RYSAFKISEVKTEEPKAVVFVDSMLNWNEHDVKNKTEEAEQVYGLMAGFESDFAVSAGNAVGDVNPAAAEFSMMGISPKVQTYPFGCDSKLSDLKKNYKHLEKLYNDSFIQVQAHKKTVKTLERLKDWYHQTQLALKEKVRILFANLENTTNTLKYSETLNAQANIKKQKWEVKFVESLARFDKWKESSKNLAKLLYSSMSTRTKLGLGFKEYIRSDEVCDLSTPSIFGLEPDNREVKSLCESKSHLIKDCHVYDTVDNFSSVVLKAASVLAGSRNSLASTTADRSIPAANRNRSASIHAGRSIPAASRNTPASIHAGRSIPAASRNRPAYIHAGRHIPAGRSNRPAPFPAGRTVLTGWINHAARPFFRPTSLYSDNVHPHVNKDIGIVDSGCSRSMTGNKEKLADFVQVKGGTVTFGGGDGKITGKGTIRTSTLDFENVYYVEELQNFNLFSVSQICDKKNKVVLRIPRRHDLYTFNLSDIQPEQHINCLLAKASLEESTKWHRWMAHVNFKTINKLAKLGLVEGLPLKLFTNEHNCVTCNKGKQHKASYKAVSANRTLIEAARSMLADSKLPTMFWTEAVSIACYVLNRVSITNPHNKTPYELLSTKIPNIRHLKPFRCLVTILNTSDHLGKFKGKANDGFLVGYATHSKAYRVYNLSSKKVEETLNLRYLEDKPNVQGLGQEWYFDLDYLTDSLGYTRFKSNTPTGTDDTNILTGTQADDSDSECDEQVI
nr:ribonuclease H-like domain-containing protein [Tanacetum cinerariifolium]